MRNPLAGAFRALRNFNFRLWTAGGLVSNTGTWMQRVAQDWIVLTQLTHHDATAVGIVTGLQFAPQLLLLPWSGLAADRFNQRKLLMLTQASMGVLATALGILTISGYVRLWHVYVFAFVFGAAAALDAPVRQTFVGELVGDKHLPNAVALNSTSFFAGQMIGPALAGLVIAKIGTGWAFLLNGLSFGAVLLSMYLLRVPELRTNARASRAPGGFIEGLRYVWARPDLRSILVMLFLIGTFGLNFPIFISTMAVNVFHTDARGFGLLSSIMAIGTLEEFIDRWAQHIPERYQHAVRSFGLFAPRALRQTSAAIFAILGQERRPRPKPRPWADSLKRDFGQDPLLDQTGKRMKWVRRLAPKIPR